MRVYYCESYSITHLSDVENLTQAKAIIDKDMEDHRDFGDARQYVVIEKGWIFTTGTQTVAFLSAEIGGEAG